MKFTFKTHKPTGPYRSFEPYRCDIKLRGKCCGYIFESNHAPVYKIFLSVKREPTKEWPAPFKNIVLEKRCDTPQEAKNFLNERIAEILEKYSLYFFED